MLSSAGCCAIAKRDHVSPPPIGFGMFRGYWMDQTPEGLRYANPASTEPSGLLVASSFQANIKPPLFKRIIAFGKEPLSPRGFVDTRVADVGIGEPFKRYWLTTMF